MRTGFGVVALLVPALALAKPRVEVTTEHATADDEARLLAIAKDLEGVVDWRADKPTGTKKFRLRIPADGGVRGLTELASTVADDGRAPAVVCKLTRHRLWSAKLRGSGTKRTVIVTFTFVPR